MSMTAAIENFMSWSERHQARMAHERLEDERQDVEEDDSSVPRATSRTIAEGSDDAPSVASTAASSITTITDASTTRTDAPAVETVLEEAEDGEETGVRTVSDDEENPLPTTDGIIRTRARQTVSLAELEEERELARRRTSACILLAVFILFRLWVEAVMEGDPGLFLLCLVGTSWTVRFVRHNREREEELDRRIAAYIENAEGEGTTEVDRNELRMLSFQAQLALAIMESQRAMIQGGFGHPDGGHHGDRGVSDEAKQHWQRFEFKSSGLPGKGTKKGGYGSLAQEDEKAATEDDVAHCSICLCEYEDGERLVRLPCSHEFHDECVSSWTDNHVRCPLCNFDLESATDESVATLSSQSPPEDSIV